ncbi:hypothetical protein FGD77_17750 [Roseovarius sp. M141]|nr:hypothetical protein [Roseovarius sp. M141]
MLERIEATPVNNGKADMPVAAALLAAVPVSAITVSRALELYRDLAKDKSLDKSEDHIRRWKMR